MNMKKVVGSESLVVSPFVTNAQRPTPNTPRSGILLLVVLSMLTLFLLIGTAFIVSANQYRKTNKILAQQVEASNSSVDQVNLLEEVLNQLVRDTNNQNSSLRFHSLLRDMYGNDGFTGTINSCTLDMNGTNVTNGQILEVRFANVATNNIKDNFGNLFSTSDLKTHSNAYNGLVLTFLDGPAHGQSTRIVGYLDDGTDHVYRVMAFNLANGQPAATVLAQLAGKRIAVNGRPFNGTGVGYNPLAVTGEKLNAVENVNGTNHEIALMPNAAFFDPLPTSAVFPQPALPALGYFGKNIPGPAARFFDGQGGSDESYDAVDFQNMVLALMPSNPTELLPATYGTGVLQDVGGMLPIPSFHRPALINYWRDQNALLHTPSSARLFEPNMLRKVMLRPSWIDHPNFTGSNPEFANLLATFQSDVTDEPAQDNLLNSTIYGPWDVDNDNDGIRDSIWVDFGAPVMENADGRLVKPMAAIMVLDMGGRLNLNAHGSEDIAKPNFNPTFSMPIAGSGNTTNLLPQGQGYGTTEISLDPLMPGTNQAQRWRWYRRLFEGAYANADFFPNDTASITPRKFKRRRVGKMGGQDNVAGRPGFDMAAQMKMQGMPRWANGKVFDSSGTPVLGGYATAPDLYGLYASVGLNDLGQPVSEAIRDYELNNKIIDQDSPYEVDLSLGASRGESSFAADTPYSMAEIERVLRAYDPDAGTLPSRIWTLAGEFKQSSSDTTPNLDNLNLWRTTLTTDSYDLPVPSVVVPGWMVETSPDTASTGDEYAVVMNKPAVGASFADLLEYRIRAAQNPVWLRIDDATDTSNPTRVTRIQREMKKLMPPDLADGLRLDINRPVGNGRDDNGNGVVDEPGEWDDTDNNGIFDTNETEAPHWASSDPRLDAFTTPFDSANPNTTGLGRFRDERILLEDRDNDGLVGSDDPVDDLNRIGVTGIVDTPAEFVTVHNLRRQMLARDLYVMAMTLVDPLPIPTAGITDPDYLKRRAQRARQLAQWAINVVDFRDPDNIMTAFEYDENPFDGWSPDGNIATTDDIYGADNKIGGTGTNADQGGMVWGSERPELLITETLGWHDRATENTNKEDPANNEDSDPLINDDDIGTVPLNANETTKLPDTDYDQRLRPKGAAFVELYCPWPENPANNADTHDTFTTPGTDLGVNLAAVSATHTDRPIASPCWRLMMYKDGGPGLNPDSHEVKLRPVLPDRSVYFTGFDPNYPQPARYLQPGPTPFARAHPDQRDAHRYVNDGVAFFNDATTNLVSSVRPGGYMVVGAGELIGTEYVSKLTSPTGSVNYSPQGISLDPTLNANTVQLQNTSGAAIMDPAGFLVQATNNVSVAIINQIEKGGTPKNRRFTFSEPANGYPDRVEGSRWDPTKGTSGAYVPTVDIPLDDQRALFEKKGFVSVPLGTGGRLQAKKRSELNDGEIRLTLPGFRQGGGFAGTKRKAGALGRDIEMASRTIPGFKWVYLQRLANPLLPWNPEPFLPNGTTSTPGYQATLAVNPYMTVDSMGANVTVYTGVSEEERRVNRAKPKDPILRFRNRIPIDTLSSLQRGRSNSPFKPSDPDGLAQLQEYLQERPDDKVVALLNSSKPNEIAMNLWNPEALGYINGTVAGVWKNEAGSASNGVAGPGSNFRGIPDHTLGFLNEPFRAAGSDPNEPKSPLSWFNWNNRPFANGGELLQVPAYSSSQLLSAYSMRDDAVAANPAKELYTKEADDATHRRKFSASIKRNLAELLDLKTDGSYGHLLNFFRTKQTDPKKDSDPTMPSTLVDDRGIVGLYRLLDYIHVPSPFVKTETWLNPASFGNSNVTSVDDPRYLHQPPFNRIAQYREPGRVNINTVVSADVWDGGLLHRQLFDPTLPWNPLTNNYQEPDLTGTPAYPGHLGPRFMENNTGTQSENGLVEARRGYPGSTTAFPIGTLAPDDTMLLLDSSVPTFFANPFRSSDAGNLVPLVNLQRPNSECTMLRRKAYNPGLDGQWGKAGDSDGTTNGIVDDLGEFGTAAPKDDIEDEDPLFAGTSTNGYNHADRNAYFRYQPMTRLSSMTTNRSNVYAVWVTVGFFEVEEAPDMIPTFKDLNDPNDNLSNPQLQALYDKVYPDGYAIGKEAGSDTGDIRRVREFAMIDRTVPVAFEPGKNHNVDKAIRLRRRIE